MPPNSKYSLGIFNQIYRFQRILGRHFIRPFLLSFTHFTLRSRHRYNYFFELHVWLSLQNISLSCVFCFRCLSTFYLTPIIMQKAIIAKYILCSSLQSVNTWFAKTSAVVIIMANFLFVNVILFSLVIRV